jgi:hypothetical protein
MFIIVIAYIIIAPAIRCLLEAKEDADELEKINWYDDNNW